MVTSLEHEFNTWQVLTYLITFQIYLPVFSRFNRSSRNTRNSSYRWRWSAWTTRLPRREGPEGWSWCSRDISARSPRTSRGSWFSGFTGSPWTSRLFHSRTKLHPWRTRASRCAGRERLPRRDRPERWEMMVFIQKSIREKTISYCICIWWLNIQYNSKGLKKKNHVLELKCCAIIPKDDVDQI